MSSKNYRCKVCGIQKKTYLIPRLCAQCVNAWFNSIIISVALGFSDEMYGKMFNQWCDGELE